MSPALVFGIGLAAALTLQAYGGFRQYGVISRQFQEIKTRNPVVSVGRATRWGMNRTAVLGFDSEGILQEAYILSGITVFAKLRRIHGHDGEHYSVVKNHYIKNKRMVCIQQAIHYMEERYG